MKKKTVTGIRLIVLALFTASITYTAYMHQVKGGGPEGAASIHALCPYGGLESLYSVLTSGSFISRIFMGTVILFAVVLLTAVLFRRGFCGWICPLGGIQEFFGRLGRKVMKRQLIMPAAIDPWLRYLKYAVLALTAAAAWITASVWMSPYDPWAAYGHLGEGIAAVWAEFPVGLVILGITLVGSFLYDRFFCKYLCPMGAFLGLVSKISPFRIKRSEEACIHCGLCTKACPVQIPVEKADTVTSAECINCQECTAVCPKEGALTNRYSFTAKLRITPIVIGMLILGLYFGGIGIARLSGAYALLPEPVDQTGAGLITDPEELKGYMTINEYSALTGLSLEDVYERMGIPAEIPSDTTGKDLGTMIPDFNLHESKEKLFE